MSNWKVSRGRCGTIPNQASIEERPAIVDTRLRFGDWEAILEIGAGRQQTLVTPNERKSRYTLIGKMQLKLPKPFPILSRPSWRLILTGRIR
jgi:IS30 family transposase